METKQFSFDVPDDQLLAPHLLCVAICRQVEPMGVRYVREVADSLIPVYGTGDINPDVVGMWVTALGAARCLHLLEQGKVFCDCADCKNDRNKILAKGERVLARGIDGIVKFAAPDQLAVIMESINLVKAGWTPSEELNRRVRDVAIARCCSEELSRIFDEHGDTVQMVDGDEIPDFILRIIKAVISSENESVKSELKSDLKSTDKTIH